MPRISTARETLARINQRIADEPNPKFRRWLEVNRDHWWGEITGDLDMVTATLSHGPVRYTYDGHPFMRPEGGLPESREAARQMYAAIQAMGALAAGPLDGERFLFDDNGMFVYGVLTAIFPGAFLTHPPEPVDPEGFYLVRVLNCTTVRFDEHDLMMGEEILNGTPLLIKRVGPEMIPQLIDGPLVV